MVDLFKELIPDLLQKKQGIIDSENEKDYNPFVVNMALSQYLDCILHANEMNINSHIDKKMQNDYYLHSLRAMKRQYTPWIKNVKNDDINSIKQFFGVSDNKAREIINIITKEDIKKIKSKLDVGGRK